MVKRTHVRKIAATAKPAKAKHAKAPTEVRQRNLMSLGRVSFVSQRGIDSLLRAVRDDKNFPEAFSRGAQYRARKAMTSLQTEYGPLVHDVDMLDKKGRPQKVACQNPLAWFVYQCEHSPDYAKIVRDALAEHPCSPDKKWSIILYQDGVDPSDGLSNNHSRKTSVFYWALAQFGMRALAHEEMWGVVNLMRTKSANELESALAQVFCKIAELFQEMHVSGVWVNISGDHGEAPIRANIFADIAVLLADSPAWKDLTACKGHSAHRCCPLCMNACNHNQVNPYHETSARFVPITCFEWTRFQKHSDETMRWAVLRINDCHSRWLAKEKGMTNERFEKIEMIHGFNWSAYNIILHERMRVGIASCLMYDWAHVYVNDGLADTEMGQCMKVLHLSSVATTYAEVKSYASTFTFPKTRGSPLHVFDESTTRNNLKKENFTSSASEFLTLTPIFHRYFQKVVLRRNVCVPQVLSTIAVLEVVMILMAVQTGCVTSEMLTLAIYTHLMRYKEAYGESAVRPKHHYALHLGDMLGRFGFLLSTFTHERKHRLVKKYTRNRCTLKSWARGALEEITCHQSHELSFPFFMVPARSAPRGKLMHHIRDLFPGAPDSEFNLHTTLKCSGGQVRRGDIVLVTSDGAQHIGELLLAVSIQSIQPFQIFCIVSLWTIDRASASSSGSALPVPKPNDNDWLPMLVSDAHLVRQSSLDITASLTYRASDDGKSALVHLPFEYSSTIDLAAP